MKLSFHGYSWICFSSNSYLDHCFGYLVDLFEFGLSFYLEFHCTYKQWTWNCFYFRVGHQHFGEHFGYQEDFWKNKF